MLTCCARWNATSESWKSCEVFCNDVLYRGYALPFSRGLVYAIERTYQYRLHGCELLQVVRATLGHLPR